MAASNHVPCPCRQTRLPRTPGLLQRSPLPGPGPPLSPSPRGVQRCLLRHIAVVVAAAASFRRRNLTRGTTAPASASRRRRRCCVCSVADAIVAQHGRGDLSPQPLQRGQGARCFCRAGLACSVRSARQGACVRGRRGSMPTTDSDGDDDHRKRAESGAAMPCSWCAISVVRGGAEA